MKAYMTKRQMDLLIEKQCKVIDSHVNNKIIIYISEMTAA